MLIFALVFFHPGTFLESSSKKTHNKKFYKDNNMFCINGAKIKRCLITSIVGAITFGIFLALNTLEL